MDVANDESNLLTEFISQKYSIVLPRGNYYEPVLKEDFPPMPAEPRITFPFDKKLRAYAISVATFLYPA